MSWYDSVTHTVKVKKDGVERELKLVTFYEYTADGKHPVQEIMELDGVGMTEDDILFMLGKEAYELALEVMSEST